MECDTSSASNRNGKVNPEGRRIPSAENHSNSSQATTVAPSEMVGRSYVTEFYHNKSVLITGGSGFVGKCLVEKLLRTCGSIGRVYLLIRAKRNKRPKERLAELLSSPLFDVVRERHGGAAAIQDKVRLVEGDVARKHLGLSERDLELISSEVSIVFHSAATLRFVEPLKRAININLTGVSNIVELCRMLTRLEALVYVSSAYANCDRCNLDEHVYTLQPEELKPERLIELASWLDEASLEALKPQLLGSRPNTYTYTKAMAEWLLARSARDLPVVICRPSIVVGSWREPVAGWIDSNYHATGMMVGWASGLVRCMVAEEKCVADMVPVDSVVNLMIALGWFAHLYQRHLCRLGADNLPQSIGHIDENFEMSETGRKINHGRAQRDEEKRRLEQGLEQFRSKMRARLVAQQLPETFVNIPVFHCTTGAENPLTWGEFLRLCMESQNLFPSLSLKLRCPGVILTTSKRLDSFLHWTLHLVPACLTDFLATTFAIDGAAGQRRRFSSTVEFFRKNKLQYEIQEPFTTREWIFRAENRTLLHEELFSDEDRRLFDSQVVSIEWPKFIKNYWLGVRKFILKEPEDTIERARCNLTYVYYRNSALQVFVVALLAYIFLA